MPESILEVAKRADLFFMQQSPIHEAMQRLTSALTEMQIPFAIAGAMAANAHGHKRTTADVDILIRREDLQRFKERYIGRGWVDKFQGSKNFRDAVCDVNIDALMVGSYPGDGLPKPIMFPEPETVTEFMDGSVPYISLKTLLEGCDLLIAPSNYGKTQKNAVFLIRLSRKHYISLRVSHLISIPGPKKQGFREQ